MKTLSDQQKLSEKNWLNIYDVMNYMYLKIPKKEVL